MVVDIDKPQLPITLKEVEDQTDPLGRSVVAVFTGPGQTGPTNYVVLLYEREHGLTKTYVYSLRKPIQQLANYHDDDKLRLTDTLVEIGYVDWTVRANGEAMVSHARIENEYRGIGLGRLLYRTAINDLVERRHVPVSDIYRSYEAERVWASLLRDNPDVVTAQPTTGERLSAFGDPSRPREYYYEVGGFVQRRPVHVRRHERRVR